MPSALETARAAEAGLKYQSEDKRSGATLAVFDITASRTC
jgi:iron complex outermembrane receptor protein